MFLDPTIDMNNVAILANQRAFVSLGTIASNFTLIENKVVTGDLTDDYTLTLPTITSTDKIIICIFDFTTTDVAYPSITNTNIKKLNNTDLVYTTTTGVRNRLIFTTFNGSDCWLVKLENYGDV